GVLVDEDCAVLKALGGGDVEVRHVAAVELPLPLLHLQPLPVIPVARMHPAERLHGEEEDELEVGHPSRQGPALEGCDEAFAGCHGAGRWGWPFTSFPPQITRSTG